MYFSCYGFSTWCFFIIWFMRANYSINDLSHILHLNDGFGFFCSPSTSTLTLKIASAGKWVFWAKFGFRFYFLCRLISSSLLNILTCKLSFKYPTSFSLVFCLRVELGHLYHVHQSILNRLQQGHHPERVISREWVIRYHGQIIPRVAIYILIMFFLFSCLFLYHDL